MTLENEMSDVVLLMISIAFVLVALLAAVTTLSAPLAARLIADGVIKGQLHRSPCLCPLGHPVFVRPAFLTPRSVFQGPESTSSQPMANSIPRADKRP